MFWSITIRQTIFRKIAISADLFLGKKGQQLIEYVYTLIIKYISKNIFYNLPPTSCCYGDGLFLRYHLLSTGNVL